MRRSRSEFVQSEAASILYQRLILRRGPVTVEDLAHALDVVQSTVTRQCTGDIPVQVRTVEAMRELDPEGFREMLDLMARAWSIDWRDAAMEVPAPEAIGQALRVIGRAADVQREIARSLDDGEFDATEREDLRRKLASLEHETKRLTAALDARELRSVVDGDFRRGA